MGCSVNKIQKPTYTKQEVAKHIKRESLWITANGRVYDITAFLSSHPGGDKIFLQIIYSIQKMRKKCGKITG